MHGSRVECNRDQIAGSVHSRCRTQATFCPSLSVAGKIEIPPPMALCGIFSITGVRVCFSPQLEKPNSDTPSQRTRTARPSRRVTGSWTPSCRPCRSGPADEVGIPADNEVNGEGFFLHFRGMYETKRGLFRLVDVHIKKYKIPAFFPHTGISTSVWFWRPTGRLML